MSLSVKVSHYDIEITYDEEKNRWYFTQDGRERSSESLAGAKKLIDTPTKERKPAFERVKVLRKGFGSVDYDPAVITSMAEGKNWNGQDMVWVLLEKSKERKKLALSDLISDSAKNRSIIAALAAMQKQKDEIAVKMHEATTRLEPVVL